MWCFGKPNYKNSHSSVVLPKEFQKSRTLTVNKKLTVLVLQAFYITRYFFLKDVRDTVSNGAYPLITTGGRVLCWTISILLHI